MTFEYPLVVQDNTGIVSRVLPPRPPDAHIQAWSTITATPTTLTGYGITDALALSGGTLTGTLDGTVFRTHNLYTNEANRETALLQWTTDVFVVRTEKAGTGVARRIEMQTDGITRMRIDTNYEIRIGDQGSSAPSIFTFSSSSITTNGAGRGFTIFGRNNVTNGTNIALAGDSFSGTAGASVHLIVAGGFAPTSGTATFTTERIAPVINQTGGATGITRGISVEPTLAAAADWRSFDTMVNTGFAYHSSGTAPSRFGGTLTVNGTLRLDTIGGSGTWAQIRSTFDTTNPDILFENSANGVLVRIRNDGNTSIGNTSPAGRFHVQGVNASIVQSIIQGAASQSANLNEWQDNAGIVLASIGSSGALTFVPFAASHTPSANNRLTFERVSDTSLTVVYRGNDGTTRRSTIPFAYLLPTTDGTNGQVLQTNGSGVLSFGSVQKTITSGTAAPSGGVDGDIYLQYV